MGGICYRHDFEQIYPQEASSQKMYSKAKIGFNDLRGSAVELAFTLANADRTGDLSSPLGG